MGDTLSKNISALRAFSPKFITSDHLFFTSHPKVLLEHPPNPLQRGNSVKKQIHDLTSYSMILYSDSIPSLKVLSIQIDPCM